MPIYYNKPLRIQFLCNWLNWGFHCPWFIRISFLNKWPFAWSHIQIGRYVLFWERGQFWKTKHLEIHP